MEIQVTPMNATTSNGAGGGGVLSQATSAGLSSNIALVAIPDAQPRPSSGDLRKWQTVRKLARKHLDDFISLQPKVLKGGTDAIHDIRVASRRLQQVIDLLYPARPPEIRKLRRRIRDLRRSLSEVRNCDVLLERVEQSLGAKRMARREAWQTAHDYLVERRSSSLEEAVREVSKLHLATVYVKMKHSLQENADPSSANGNAAIGHTAAQVMDAFDEQLHLAFRKVFAAYRTDVERSLADATPPALHGARIAAKRLRYLIEVLQELQVEGSGEALDWLKHLQEHLGDWHDLEVLEEMLIDMVARPRFLRDQLELAMSVERLLLGNRARRQRYVQRYFEMVRSPEAASQLLAWGDRVLGEVHTEPNEPEEQAETTVPSVAEG